MGFKHYITEAKDKAVELQKKTGIKPKDGRHADEKIFTFKNKDTLVVRADKTRMDYYTKDEKFITSYTTIGQVIKAMDSGNWMNEKVNDFTAFIPYIPDNIKKIKSFVGGKVKTHKGVMYMYFIIDILALDEEENEEYVTTFKISIVGSSAHMYVDDSGHHREFGKETKNRMDPLGQWNLNSAGGMIELSKKLKKQSLIGDFEEWYLKTHNAKQTGSFNEEVVDEAKPTIINKKDILFKEILSDGNVFVTIARDTKDMPGTQDKFSMFVINPKGKVVKDMGSHPSLKGSQAFMKNNMDELTEENIDESTKSFLKDFNVRVKNLKEEIKNDTNNIYGSVESLISLLETFKKEL